MRQCRFETLPFGRTTSLPCTRPTVTSFFSNVSCLGSPPFSVRVRITMRQTVCLKTSLVHPVCCARFGSVRESRRLTRRGRRCGRREDRGDRLVEHRCHAEQREEHH